MLKDLLYLKRTTKVLLLLLAFYLVLFMTAGSESAASGALSGIIVMLTLILSANAFAYDETAKWKTYELSLPVPRHRIVLARYLLTLAFSTALSLCSLLGEWIAYRGVLWESAAAVLASWSISLLFCAVLFPAMYKYGSQKARLVLIVFVMLPVLFLLLLSKANLPMPGGSALTLIFRLLPLLAAAAYGASYGISCRIFATGTRKSGIGSKTCRGRLFHL